jgi:hypothetical protein
MKGAEEDRDQGSGVRIQDTGYRIQDTESKEKMEETFTTKIDLWLQVLERIKKERPTLYSALSDGKVEIRDDILLLVFENSFAPNKRIADKDENKRLIEEAIYGIIKQRINFSTKLLDGKEGVNIAKKAILLDERKEADTFEKAKSIFSAEVIK